MLTCRICLKKKREGDDTVLRTQFARLNDHIRKQHPGTNVTKLTSLERNRRCRSKGKRRVFLCRCQQIVVKKRQHLRSKTYHPELVGVPATAPVYLKLLKGFKSLTHKYVKTATKTRPDDAGEEDSGSSDEEEKENNDPEEEGHTLTRPYVLSIQKNARVMRGRRDFKLVVQWAEWRQKRIGGGKDFEQVDKGKVMINRFLALVGFEESDENSLESKLKDDDNIELYDEYMTSTFEPGTVRSSYCYVNSFLDFLLYAKVINETVYKTIKLLAANLSSASKKADGRRRKAMRRIESTCIPKNPVEVVELFNKSDYVTAVKQQWKNGNRLVWKEMRGILLVEMSAKNGTRCGEFRNLQYKHVVNAKVFEKTPELRTLVIDQHKTMTWYEATIHVTKALYKDLLDYICLTRKLIWGSNPSDELYVFQTEDCQGTNPVQHTLIDRWLKRAWKKAEMHGHYPGYVPSLTKGRKSITTDVRQRKRHLAEDVAHMLCHKKTTADRHYDLVEQVERSQQTYNELYGGNMEENMEDNVEENNMEQNMEQNDMEEDIEENNMEDKSARNTPVLPLEETTTAPTLTAVVFNATSKEEQIQVARDIDKRCFVKLQRLQLPVGIKSVKVPQPDPNPEFADVDENLESLQGALHDFNYYKRQAEKEEEEQSSPPRSFQALWKPKKAKMFWSEEETKEVREVFRDTIKESISRDTTVPMHIISSLRDGKWPRFTNMQVREKVRNLAKTGRVWFMR